MNIVYLNTHDTGTAISPYGYPVKTANLQKFAQESTLFTHAYCCNPTCSPSRAALLTGLYPHQNGMFGLAQRGFKLHDSQKHLANFLRHHGYETVLSGIQHEAGWYLDIDVEKTRELGYETILTSDPQAYTEHKEQLYQWDRQNALNVGKWLAKRQSKKPFFLAYGLHSTHRPYPAVNPAAVNPQYLKPHSPAYNNETNRLDEAEFQTSAFYADQNIGLVLEALKRNGYYDNSIIIYTTDHGIPIPFNKCFLNDNGIAVSLLMRLPFKETQGLVIDQIVSQIDIFPTLCELSELEKPAYLSGKSFRKLFKNKEEHFRDYIFAELNFHTSYEPARCVRNERFKYIKYYDNTWLKFNLSNIDNSLTKDFYLANDLKTKHKAQEALYDTYYDPLESNNLLNDPHYQTELKKLQGYLKTVQQETADPLLQGPLPLLDQYKVNRRACLNPSSKDPADYLSLGK